MTVVGISFPKPFIETHYTSFCPSALGGWDRLGIVPIGPIMRRFLSYAAIPLCLHISVLYVTCPSCWKFTSWPHLCHTCFVSKQLAFLMLRSDGLFWRYPHLTYLRSNHAAYYPPSDELGFISHQLIMKLLLTAKHIHLAPNQACGLGYSPCCDRWTSLVVSCHVLQFTWCLPWTFKFIVVVKSAAWAAEFLMRFDWHPLTDTNATVSNINVTVANWLD